MKDQAILFTIVSLLFCVNMKAQEVNCNKFKTGTFEHFVDGKFTGTIIKRGIDFQFETNKKKRVQTKDKITWLDDCSFKLTMVGGGDNDSNLIIRIIETGESHYVYDVWAESNPKKVFQNKMVKIIDERK